MSKSWRWLQILCMLLLLRRNWKIVPDRKWQQTGSACRRRVAPMLLLLMQPQISSPRSCCDEHRKHDKKEAGIFKKDFTCTETLCLCSKTYCSFDVTTNKHKFSSKGLNKHVLEQSVVGNLDKHHRVLDEKKILRQQTELFEQTITL